jgi:hypothetical protein
MLSENNTDRVWFHLFGGALDGHRREIITTEPFEKVWVCHCRNDDVAMILEMTAEEQRKLQDQYALMAYEVYDEVDLPGGREIRYRRLESADRVAD